MAASSPGMNVAKREVVIDTVRLNGYRWRYYGGETFDDPETKRAVEYLQNDHAPLNPMKHMTMFERVVSESEPVVIVDNGTGDTDGDR